MKEPSFVDKAEDCAQSALGYAVVGDTLAMAEQFERAIAYLAIAISFGPDGPK